MKKKNIFLNNYIIAEIGTNHNKSFYKAIKMIDLASQTKCDAVKFQIYEPYEIVSKLVMAKDYGLDKFYGNISANKMFDKYLKTPKNWFPKIKNYCKTKKMDVGVTIHGEEGIRWAKKIKPDFIKIASMDHNNFPFISKLINSINVPILVSVGMAKKNDIFYLVKILKKHKYGSGIFHCTSLYPPKKNENRMKNIVFFKQKLKTNIGYSDHNVGFKMAKLAKEYGATFFEKHITLNKKDKGPDHAFALNMKEFKEYCEKLKKKKKKKNLNIRNLKFIDLTKREEQIRKKYLKSLIAKKKIIKGKKLKKKEIYLARPGNGIEPKYLEFVIGKKTNLNIKKENIIKWKDLKI